MRFFQRCLHVLPERYLTIVFFARSGLDVLDALHVVDKPGLIEWIYSLQVLPTDDSESLTLHSSHLSCDRSSVTLLPYVDGAAVAQSYDSGIGQGAGLESHGESHTCLQSPSVKLVMITALSSLRRIHVLCRGVSVHDGKAAGDSRTASTACYSFWLGATLQVLTIHKTVSYLVNALCRRSADPLHTYLCICGLSLMAEAELALNISVGAFESLQQLQEAWRQKST
uniref:Prenyltransferase alpha-alpha toroid domain-containing protein n=1 Tax=Sinocyclocheilus anshuiensis TaxID=1608454 RepID=A0A671M2V0_9TELE